MIRNALTIAFGLTLWIGPCLFCWGAMLLLVTGCSSVQDPPAVPVPGPVVAADDARLEALLEPPLVPWALAMLDVPHRRPQVGQVRRLHGKTHCKAGIPLPYLLPDPRPPVVGQDWQCTLVSSVSSLPAEPDWFMWLVVSTQPPAPGLPAELSPIGLPGCVLHQNPELLLSIPPGAHRQSGAFLVWREAERGRAFLRWRPQPGMAGRKLWLQLLVHAPGRSPGGFLTSYGLELAVSSGSQ